MHIILEVFCSPLQTPLELSPQVAETWGDDPDVFFVAPSLLREDLDSKTIVPRRRGRKSA